MPATDAQTAHELARQSSDCSFLLTHLVRPAEDRADAGCRDILKRILGLDADASRPLLKGSRVGWYASVSANVFNPITSRFDGPACAPAVCFTESTLAGLRAHRDVFQAQYGLAFDRDYLFSRGANPCLNIRQDLLKKEFTRDGEGYSRSVYNFIPPQLHPFVNVIHQSFDATHEREWRVSGDLSFEYLDVMFVFCPESEFPAFARIQSSGRPVLFDLAWLDRV